MPATEIVETPTEDLEETFQLAADHFGHVPNLVKVLATNPTLCKSITEFFAQALKDGRVSWSFKELVILKTLRAVGSHYSYGAHEKLASQLGNSDQRIGDLANSIWRNSPEYTDGERHVFELVDQIAEDANDVSDALWTRLKACWDHGQLLELTAVITTIVMIGRVGDTLGISDPVLFTRPLS